MSAEHRTFAPVEKISSQFSTRPLCVEDLESLPSIILPWVRLSKDISVTPEAKTQRYVADMEQSTYEGSPNYYAIAQTATGEVIGVGGIKQISQDLIPFTTTSHPIEIVNMYVHTEHRLGKGVGTGIIDELTTVATDKGHTEVILISGPTFQGTGWGFYQRLEQTRGFEYLGMAQDYYGEGIDAPVWRKSLERP